ncbi:MAG: hypothetical protein ACAI35_11005 [Candidatus Methylacidiphilales bacterium]|nr:hypothetical protein [Candidatus Methylacidiphilales bacterium]
MRKLLLHNWQAKAISLVLAVMWWIVWKELVQAGFIDQLITGTIPSSEQ